MSDCCSMRCFSIIRGWIEGLRLFDGDPIVGLFRRFQDRIGYQDDLAEGRIAFHFGVRLTRPLSGITSSISGL